MEKECCFRVEQAFVVRDEKRAPLKTPAWKAIISKASFDFLALFNYFHQTTVLIHGESSHLYVT